MIAVTVSVTMECAARLVPLVPAMFLSLTERYALCCSLHMYLHTPSTNPDFDAH